MLHLFRILANCFSLVRLHVIRQYTVLQLVGFCGLPGMNIMTQFFRHSIASLLLFIYLPLSVAVPFLHCHSEEAYRAYTAAEVQAAHDAEHHAVSECTVCLACQFLHSHFAEPSNDDVQTHSVSYIVVFSKAEHVTCSDSNNTSSRAPPPVLPA